MTTTMTSKGQVTVPKAMRDHLGIGPGTRVAFRLAAGGQVTLARADGTPPPDRFTQLLGSAGPGLTTDDIMVLTRGDDMA